MSRPIRPGAARPSALRHVRDGRTWFYLPCWVVDDLPGGVLIQLVPGTSGCAAYRADGTRAHLADRRWRLAPYVWSQNVLTYYVPWGRPIAVGLLSSNQVPFQWYANVQRRLSETELGFETLDYELDWQSPWRDGTTPRPWDWRVKDVRAWLAAVGSSGVGVPVAVSGASSICFASAVLRADTTREMERWARTPSAPPPMAHIDARPKDVGACLDT